MHFQVSLFYFALLIFLVKNGAGSLGLHGYISVCPRRAVDFFNRKGVKLVVGRKCSVASCKPHDWRVTLQLYEHNIATWDVEINAKHIFCVVYFDVSDICIWQLWILFFGSCIRVMASSSTLPSSGKVDGFPLMGSWFYYIICCNKKYWFLQKSMDLLRKTCRCCSMHGFRFCPAGVGGSLVDRHLQELRGVRDGCIGRASQEEQLRLRLHELGLPLNGRRSDDISLRKLCQAMDISLQHPSGDRKGRDELVEALVSALLFELPVLGNLHMSFVDACLKDLREVRDSGSGQAPQRDELEKRLCKFAIKDKRDHVVTLTDLCRSLELPIATSRGWMSKAEYVQQILTALLAELPATASVDDGKTALVDASLRELLAFRDSLTEQQSQRRQLESRLEQFNVRDRRSDAVTVVDLWKSLGLATKHAGRYFPKADLVGQIVSTLLRRVPAAASRDVAKASVDACLQELRRVRDGVNEQAAQRCELEKGLDKIKMKDQGGDAVDFAGWTLS